VTNKTQMAREPGLGPSSVVSAKRNLLCCDVNDESIVLDDESGTYFGFNSVGSRIWSLVQEPIALADAVGVLTSEFDVGVDECEAELYRFVRELEAKSLVEVRP